MVQSQCVRLQEDSDKARADKERVELILEEFHNEETSKSSYEVR